MDSVPSHFVPAQTAALSNGRPFRILISYHYFKNVDMDAMMRKHFVEPYPEVFLDSGAWSAFTCGVPISMPDYQAFIRRFDHWFSVYSNLDDMKCPETTYRNHQVMKDAGLSPLPAFHTGEDFRHLERYLDEGYNYIGVGGMVPYLKTPKKVVPWLLKAFRLAGDRAVFHGFGATCWEIASSLPWYSVDSSSWTAGIRFGGVSVFDPVVGKFHTIQLGDRPAWAKHARLVRSYDFDPEDFADRARNVREKILGLCAASYMESELWLRRRHGLVSIPGGEGRGVKVHLAGHAFDFAEVQKPGSPAGIRVHLATSTSDDFPGVQAIINPPHRKGTT